MSVAPQSEAQVAEIGAEANNTSIAKAKKNEKSGLSCFFGVLFTVRENGMRTNSFISKYGPEGEDLQRLILTYASNSRWGNHEAADRALLDYRRLKRTLLERR